MHQYLEAIGFKSIKSRKELKELLKEVEVKFSQHELVTTDEGVDFCEFRKAFGEGIGISVCGEMDEKDIFEREYYFPYFKGTGVTSYADILVERKIEKEEYIGVCEDIKVGVSLIFHLQNAVEYMREKQLGNLPEKTTSLTLSGLALAGTVLFPIKKNKKQEKSIKEDTRNRMMLLSAARNGDQEAIESLTLEDIDTYSKVSKRLITEDVFSIVDTYFMPYGVECDQYSILGEIIDISMVYNKEGDQMLYRLKLDANELIFDVCIPEDSVIGEPEIGRRFKANIWLQGYINF